MPAPVTHIVLALSILPFLPGKNKDEFLRGTSFPDIRYLSGISRETTHLPGNWDLIKNEQSSFKAGMLFHSLVDRIHDQYMNSYNAYEFVPAPGFKPYFFKFYEDYILYNKISDWSSICNCFDFISPEETTYGISEKTITMWHERLQNYCREKPNTHVMIQLVTPKRSFAHWVTAEIMKLVIERCKRSPELHKLIVDFYIQFPNLLMKN